MNIGQNASHYGATGVGEADGSNSSNRSSGGNATGLELATVMRYTGMIYYLILIVGGTLGNIMAIVAIWTNRAMKKTRLVFIVLAVSDTAVLLTNPPRYFVKFVNGFEVREFDVFSCKLHTFLTYLVKDVATWVLVLISFERLLATWAPYHLSKYHSSKLPLLIWASVMLLLLLKNASLLFVVTITTLPDGRQRKLCDCETHFLTFRQAFMWTDSFVYCFLPSLCLFVFNGGILYALHRSRKVNIRKHQRGSIRGIEPHLALSLPFPAARGRRPAPHQTKLLSAVGQSSCEVGVMMMLTTKSLMGKIDSRVSAPLPAEPEPEPALESKPKLQLEETPSLSLLSPAAAAGDFNGAPRRLSQDEDSVSVSMSVTMTRGTGGKERTRKLIRSRNGSSRRETGARQSLATSLLIPVSLFHLVTTLPYAVVSVFEAVLKIKHGSDQALNARIQTIGSLVVMLMYLNNGLNCLVYFVSSQRFRNHFISLLGGRSRKRCMVQRAASVPSSGSAYYRQVPAVYLCNSTAASSERDVGRSDILSSCSEVPIGELLPLRRHAQETNASLNASSSSIQPSESNSLVLAPHTHTLTAPRSKSD